MKFNRCGIFQSKVPHKVALRRSSTINVTPHGVQVHKTIQGIADIRSEVLKTIWEMADALEKIINSIYKKSFGMKGIHVECS